MEILTVGNSYRAVNVFENARAHLGNSYENRYELEDPLKHLPFASNSPFNAFYRQHDSGCLAGTRVEVLDKIRRWVDGGDKSCIFWLSGWPGTGKSAIARTIAREFDGQGRLAASFFFSRGGGDSSHAGLFVTTVARQLADCRALGVGRYIRDSVEEQSQVSAQTLRDQWARLVLKPLSQREKNATPNVFLLVIDALDECEDERSIETLLQLLPQLNELAETRMRVLVTSRREPPIRHGFRRMGTTAYHDFVLHHIPREVTSRDIEVFLVCRLSEIALECCLSSDWPSRQVLALMVQHAQGLFIWAETACKYVREGGGRFARRRLDVLMDHSNSAIAGPTEHLDKIYTTILHASVPGKFNEDEQKVAYDHLKIVLGTIVVLYSTISAAALSKLLNVTIDEVLQTIEELHSILDVPEDVADPLRLHHDSFRNFLMDENRCQDGRVFVRKESAHTRLVTGCIQIMSSILKEDVCDQRVPGMLWCDVDTSCIQRCLPQQVQYACLYWVSHVVESRRQLTCDDEVYTFLQKHILHWIEAMSWMGRTSEAIEAMASLEVITKDERCTALHALIYDAKRFVMYARSGIEQAPLQTYVSAALFAPSKSIVRELFGSTTLVDCIEHSLQTHVHWSAMLLTLESPSGWVTTVQFSGDGSKLASASHNGTVMLWDPNTGARLQTLEGHSSPVHTVQFSGDGSKLASASDDGSVIVWDQNTGAQLRTLQDHSEGVHTVQFSPDGSKLTTASHDNKVIVWDPNTGAQLRTLQGHSDSVHTVQFSPDGSKLASSSSDGTVIVWDPNTGAQLRMLQGHSDGVHTVQFSGDGSKLASASDDGTVIVWDSNTGAQLRTLQGHSNSVHTVQFSPDGIKLVSSSSDGTVIVWDSNTEAQLWTLQGYPDNTYSVQFSGDGSKLASASDGCAVIVWDSNTGARLRTLQGHSDSIHTVQFSPDGSKLVSSSSDDTVIVWDTNAGAQLETLHTEYHVSDMIFSVEGSLLQTHIGSFDLYALKGHSDSVNNVRFSPDGSKLASASSDGTVIVWDPNAGAQLRLLQGHSDGVHTVRFSPDGSKLASASYDKNVIVWDPTTGARQHTLEGHSYAAAVIQFSLDGSKLASASYDNKVTVWDLTTGARQHMLEGHLSRVNAMQFSGDNSTLASASYDRTVMLWDPTTGAQMRTLEGHSDWVTTVQFSPDGSKLASASSDGTVIVWNPNTGARLRTLEGHSDWITAMQFSVDGRKLATASSDLTVIVWDPNTGFQLETLHTEYHVSDMIFPVEGYLLQTNIGSFDLQAGMSAPSGEDARVLRPQPQDGLWRDHRTILSSPEQLRSNSANAIHWPIVAFGHPTGTVHVVHDDLQHRPEETEDLIDSNTARSTNGMSSEYTRTFYFDAQKGWIHRHGQKIIWLPSEFRPYGGSMARRGAIMVFGHAAGKVSFWKML